MKGRRLREDLTMGEAVEFRRPRRRVDWARLAVLGVIWAGCGAIWILVGTCAWRVLHG